MSLIPRISWQRNYLVKSTEANGPGLTAIHCAGLLVQSPWQWTKRPRSDSWWQSSKISLAWLRWNEERTTRLWLPVTSCISLGNILDSWKHTGSFSRPLSISSSSSCTNHTRVSRTWLAILSLRLLGSARDILLLYSRVKQSPSLRRLSEPCARSHVIFHLSRSILSTRLAVIWSLHSPKKITRKDSLQS